MSQYTVICENCNTKVARTPSNICIKCGAGNWERRIMANHQIECENCNTIVAKTPDNKCIQCSAIHWSKANQKSFSLFSTVSISLCVFMLTILCFGLSKSKTIQSQKEQYFALNHVQFGMLSVKEWKSRVADILIKKIDEFELTGDNRGKIKQMIEQGLSRAVYEIKSIIQLKKNDSFWGGLIISFIEDFAINIEDFESRIPYIAENIMRDLDSQQNQTDLKVMIKQRLLEYLDRTVRDEDYTKLERLLHQINCSDRETCNTSLKIEISNNTKHLKLYVFFCILIFLSIGLLAFFATDKLGSISYIIGSSLLLIGGIAFPMIDIDARIEQFKFLLIGEPLVFSNQILFFQSKSIVDVVVILFKNGALDSILVAFLILLFSILFPLAKIISSSIFLFKPSIASNRIVSFMMYKSAKWSMADVFVIAVFMAFIGFKSIIKNQLGQLNELEDNLEILTMDNTTFQFGFLLFIMFTISSLFMPYYLKLRNE